MVGIRKKIAIGFFTLGILLFFSGMVSLIELNKLSRTTQNLLETASINTSLSKRMLDAAQAQNSSLLEMVVLGKEGVDSTFMAARAELENALEEASRYAPDQKELNDIYSAKGNYYDLVTTFADEDRNTDIEWFVEMYKHSYDHLTTAIKNYLMSSQTLLLGKTEQLESNAYRAITPGIITLCVAILIVLMFAFLLNHYYTRPIVKITKGLNDYLNRKIPFRITVDGKDEVHRLGEYVEELIARDKKS